MLSKPMRLYPYDRLGPDAAAAAYFNRSVAAYRCGQPDEAAGYFTFATTADTTRSDANYWLGVIAFDNGDYDAAARHFALVSPAGESRTPRARIYGTDRVHARAVAACRLLPRPPCATLPPTAVPRLMRIAGEALCRQGKEAEGLDYLRRYLDATSEPELSALYIVGTDDYRHGRYAEAAERLAPVAAGADGAMKQSAYLFIGQSLFCSRATAMPPSWHSIRPSKCRRRQGRGGGRHCTTISPHASTVPRCPSAMPPLPSRVPSPLSLPVPMPSVWRGLADIYIADHDYDRAIERLSGIRQPSRRTRELLQRAHYSSGMERHRQPRLCCGRRSSERCSGNRRRRLCALEVKALQGITAMQRGDNAAAEGSFRLYPPCALGRREYCRGVLSSGLRAL